MKTLYIILLLSLVGCMSANKHYEKAIKKGYTPEKEIVEIERLEIKYTIDSITNEIVHTDTFIVRETRTIYQDRPITRQERLKYKDSLNYLKAEISNERKKAKEIHNKELKLAQIESKRLEMELNELRAIAKIENKTKRGFFYWIRWLVISFGLGFLTAVFRKQLLKLLLKIPLPFK